MQHQGLPARINESYEQRWGWRDPELYVYKPKRGLSQEVVEEISWLKSEPEWMRMFRLKAYQRFISKPFPTWGADLSKIDFQNIYYFLRAIAEPGRTREEVLTAIEQLFDRLGIPEAERKYLAGVSAQYESEVVYHHMKSDLSARGVIFTDMDSAVRDYPELVRKYFARWMDRWAKEIAHTLARSRCATSCLSRICGSKNNPFLIEGEPPWLSTLRKEA